MKKGSDRSPDGRRVRRHDFQRAAQTPATPATPRKPLTPATPSGEQEDRQVGRQKKARAKAKSKKAESKAKPQPALHGPRKTQKAGPPAFFFFVTRLLRLLPGRKRDTIAA